MIVAWLRLRDRFGIRQYSTCSDGWGMEGGKGGVSGLEHGSGWLRLALLGLVGIILSLLWSCWLTSLLDCTVLFRNKSDMDHHVGGCEEKGVRN